MWYLLALWVRSFLPHQLNVQIEMSTSILTMEKLNKRYQFLNTNKHIEEKANKALTIYKLY